MPRPSPVTPTRRAGRIVAAATAALVAATSTLAASSATADDLPEVALVEAGDGWELLVRGEPWVVKGMTWGPPVDQAATLLPGLRATGANTIRTWGTDASSKTLFDAAADLDMRVIAGFWLQPGGGPGSGGCPDYTTDVAYLNAVRDDVTTWTTAYKDHPGVLMWSVGNESLIGMTACWSGSQLEVQRVAYTQFVDELALLIRSIDPNHPVTSTDAWVGAWPYYRAHAPNLDLYAINSYGAVCGIQEYWEVGGYDKPYVLTEGGPAGEWEVDDDANGVPDEPTDLEKARAYQDSWECLMDHEGVALGATMFHYGTESDFGGVWFNVLPGGQRRLSYVAVAEMYGGTVPANTPPVISEMTVEDADGVAPGATVRIDTTVADPDGDPLTYDVRVSGAYVDGSWALTPAEFTHLGDGAFELRAPDRFGVWKVYVFARDGQGNVGIETRSLRVVNTVTGTNIALGRPADASSFDPWNGNWGPWQAVDGDLTTRWASAWSDEEWISVDLGEVRDFDRVQLVWEAAYGRGYLIQVSDDGETWTTVFTETDGDGGVDDIDVGGTGRYVRMLGTQRGTAYGYSLFELGVYVDGEEPVTGPEFVDVPPGHGFYEEIRWLADEGLSAGTVIDGEHWFFPGRSMSRQAMAAFVFRYLGDPDWQPGAGTQTFSDVPVTSPFHREIEWLAAQGLAEGYADGTFGPGGAVSRQAMAAFLHRLAGAPPAEAPSFSDVPADHPFAAEIGWLEASGVAQGYADGTFGPGNRISRQAMAAYLFRFDTR